MRPGASSASNVSEQRAPAARRRRPLLLLVRSKDWGTQARLAEAMGITGATLTHHLNSLESQGLVRRWREASNRRVQHVELTDEGRALFDRLRQVAARHDTRLRSKLTDEETLLLAELLDKLQAGLQDADTPAEPVADSPGMTIATS